MPEDGARPVVVDNPAAIPLDMDAILKSDPQKMAADLSRLAQVLQALSADLETRAAQEPSRKEVEE